MTRDIDDIVDERTRGLKSVGENYHSTFLNKRPKTEWSPFIDESAKDLRSGIQLSDLALSKDNFGPELGAYYRQGLKTSVGRFADLPSVLEQKVSDEKLGLLAYQLNELSYDISTSDLGITDVEKATEAVIEKLLIRHVGADLSVSFDLAGATVTDITTQLFSNETVAAHVDLLLDKFANSASQGLLSLLDEPQMITPLWPHQREALEAWCEHDYRGYVDMATATGKTVLGLAALALKYGELHPDDQTIGIQGRQSNTGGSDDVLIVAHSDLILTQWRREFEKHLNIPKERTSGSDDITLEWGTIHFRTPQSLVNEDRVAYDLVLLDEAHHYATGSEWGSLLDEFEGDILAMSGSVDDAGSDSARIRDRLTNSIGPQVKRFTITEARTAGVIPSFDWEIHYAPYDVVGDDLEKISARTDRSFQEFQSRLENGELGLETDRRLKTYEDVRRFSHTTEGNTLKQEDPSFRDLITQLFSRRTKQWNLSPTLDAVVELVIEHHTTEKIVVLADSNAQVDEFESRLQNALSNPAGIYRVSGSQDVADQLETIDEFDEPESQGVLLGTGDLLGEGVDIQHASVAINMATGGVNQELVQRIGRVLRNPGETPKHAMFYNVVGVPPTTAAAVPREDGKQLLEQAAAFCSLGRRFEKLPGFARSESLDGNVVETLLREGTEFIDSLDADGAYDWDEGINTEADLRALHKAVQTNTGDIETILGEWEEYAWAHSKQTETPTEDSEDDGSTESVDAGQDSDEERTKGVGNDGEELTPTKRAHIEDLVRLQPTNNSTLEHQWALSSVAEVRDYLQSELGDYYFRDGDDLIWASDEAEALVNTEAQSPGDPPEEGKGPDSEPDAEQEEPTERDLLEELCHLEETLGSPPTKDEMERRGTYSVEKVEEVFGSWSDAIKEAWSMTHEQANTEYTREDVLSGLRNVAAELGASPTVADVNEHAPFSASVIYSYFDSIEAARVAAGTNPSQDDEATETSETETAPSIEANPLAEYYELLRTYASLLERIIDAEQTTYSSEDDTPMTRWRSAVSDVVFGEGPTEEAPPYGNQQAERNPHTMPEYRNVFGNGETITDYQFASVRALNEQDQIDLIDQGIIQADERFYLPIAPASGDPLPLAVTTDAELEDALQLLSEFPPIPPAAEQDESVTEGSSETDNQSDSQPTTDTDEAKTPTGEPSDDNTGKADEEEPEDGDSSSEEDQSTNSQTIFWKTDVDPLTEYEDDPIAEEDTANGDELDRKIDEWKSQLLDLTRRNKLVSFKPTKTKSLPFEETNPTAIAAELIDGGELFIRKQPTDTRTADSDDALAANEVRSTRTADEAENSLSSISLKNKQYLRERGVDSLYLSLGMLRWYSVDHSEEANRSPLFLAPVELEERTLQDGEKHDYVITPKAEGLRLNPALRKKLAAERGISLPADEAITLESIDAAFQAVYETIQGFERWTIQPDVVLGIFDFTKYSLYADLERNRPAIKNHPIIQALVGNMGPLQAAEGDITTPTASELDKVVDPVDTYQVLDADSSQQEAIEAAKRGKSFVLQGPPGTGKSQTIANIIAEKLAVGERVLFVSEKQAALDVVKNRLDDVGLGRFCLEVHGTKANNTDVLAGLESELKAPQIKSPTNRDKRLAKLRERRATINQYGEQLFFSPEGWNTTAYQAFGIVSDHSDVPRIEIDINEPLDIDQETVDAAIDELETLSRFSDQLEAYESSPWRHTTLRQWGVDTGDAMRQSLDRQLEAIEDLKAVADAVEDAVGVRPASLAALREWQQVLRHVSSRPDITWQDAFFQESFAQAGDRLGELADLEQERATLLAELTQHYERSFFSTNGVELNDELASFGLLKRLQPSYRSLNRKLMNHTQEGYDPSHEQLLADTRKLATIQRIEDRRDEFRGLIDRLGPLYNGGDTEWETIQQAQQWVSTFKNFEPEQTDPIETKLLERSLPPIPPLLEQIETALTTYEDAAAFFEEAIAVEDIRVDGTPFTETPFEELVAYLRERRGDVPGLQRRVQFEAQLDRVRETICESYVERFLHGDYQSDDLVPAFRKRFYTEWLNSIYEQTALGSFTADEMERYVEEFRRLDQEQQELAKIEVQHQVTKRRPSLNLEHASSSEQVLVRRETEKQRRHKPLRELFDEAGSFITRLTPCFMMSPLSVAQYLKADSIKFDTVVFDEASQIMPQDAISSLIRADQAIIAGDTKQLPPTSFFQSDVETTEDVREDLDSILEETASVLSEKNLRWHYRSRTEELIQFSNHHYYNNSLRTFPENDPAVETGVKFEYVEDGIYDRGGSRQNEIEAQRVIDLVEAHAEEHSEKSLGVVAFSSAQEQAIRDALAERREENPVLDAFVSQDDVLDEFFIKNLEMVQGDERDRMIFSIGYGPAQDGTISTNFGPVNKSGGERRLNVAITRAKEQITVVCSMLPEDIDLSGSNSTGAKHFKNYLEYARNGTQALLRNDSVTNTLEFDSSFEEAVYDALTAAGYDVISQVESASYSIDLGIKHPDHPGKFVLGIECDGAAYHSSKTARDRDRTRQMVLEDLGWTIHRIWSPDWTSNQERELQRIHDKVETLIEGNTLVDEPTDVPSYEPESLESGSKTDHEEITEYTEPALSWNSRYDTDKHGVDQANRNAIQDTVTEFGPLSFDSAMRTKLDVRSQARAGKKIQRLFRKRVDDLKAQGVIYERDEFLWPQIDALEFRVRINTDTASRQITEIPLEEIAKALIIILQEGGTITPDDIVLETTRLFGYQRRGSRIETRIKEALTLLEQENLVSVDDKITLTSDDTPDSAILSRIYPNVAESTVSSDKRQRQPPSEQQSTGVQNNPSTSESPVDEADAEFADYSFPFFDFGRDQWKVPCPYCSSQIHNVKKAFLAHWSESDSCSGPNSTPPPNLSEVSQSEWDEITKQVSSAMKN